jgi:ABC-type transporter Mla MlaB component
MDADADSDADANANVDLDVSWLVPADLSAVDALARLHATASRRGRSLQLHGACGGLTELLGFCGLGDVVHLCGCCGPGDTGRGAGRRGTGQ